MSENKILMPDELPETNGLSIQEKEKLISDKLLSAYRNTYGKGINPEAVEIMYNTLTALSRELDNYFASITHEDITSMGFRREIKELHSFAKAAINKAKNI